MTDRDDLADRLDAVEENLAATPPGENVFFIVYQTDAGIVTPDGEPVPRDAEGDLNPPGVRDSQLVVTLPDVMAPDAVKTDGGARDGDDDDVYEYADGDEDLVIDFTEVDT